MLTSSNKSETAVHSCDPALSVPVMLVSRNVFPVVSALQSIASGSQLQLPSVSHLSSLAPGGIFVPIVLFSSLGSKMRDPGNEVGSVK